MESPPRPKRFLSSIENLALRDVEKREKESSPQASSNKRLTEATVGSSFCAGDLHCLSSSPKALGKTESSMPNLCVFVSEVANQQQQQMDQLDDLAALLQKKKSKLSLLKIKYERIQSEQRSIKRMTFLAMEEAATQRKKISDLRDEILTLLNQESQLQRSLKRKKIEPFFNKKHFRTKMQKYEEQIREAESNNEINKKIQKAKLNINDYEEKIKQNVSNLQQTDTCGRVSEYEANLCELKNEKDKLKKILQRKTDLINVEDSLLKELNLQGEMTKKRAAAQKLRLRSRVMEKRLLVQQIEEEAAVLQIQIDDLKSEI